MNTSRSKRAAKKTNAKAGTRKRQPRKPYYFYPECPRTVKRTIRIPEIIYQRLRGLVSQHASHGLGTGVLDADFILRILDWVGVQEPRVLTAIVTRNSVLPCEVPEGGISGRDLGPGECSLLSRLGLALRFGRTLYQVTPAGDAPFLEGAQPRFSKAERDYLKELGAEIDDKYGGSANDDGPHSALGSDAMPTGEQ